LQQKQKITSVFFVAGGAGAGGGGGDGSGGGGQQ